MVLRDTSSFHVIVLIITLALAYTFRVEIMIGGGHVATLFDSPGADHMLGEYYTARSDENANRAAFHFERSLRLQKKKLDTSPEELRKWIYYTIARHYECGQGVNKDMATAKLWYEKAAKHGITKDMKRSELFEKAIKDFKKSEGIID